MSLWRLEWLRLVRTRRVLALFGVYLFFGTTSPLLARYLNEFLQRMGNGIQVLAPAPAPVDGFATYVSNANQLGLLASTLVISSAVAVDAQREMAVFLRTRVRRHRDLLIPKYVVNVAAAAGAFTAGALATWYGTALLLGPVDAPGVLAGTALSALYLAFAGALAAALGSRLASVVSTAIATLALILLLGIASRIPTVGDWLPNHLLGAVTDLATGGDARTYLPALAVTAVSSAGLLALAARWGATREL